MSAFILSYQIKFKFLRLLFRESLNSVVQYPVQHQNQNYSYLYVLEVDQKITILATKSTDCTKSYKNCYRIV